MREVWALISAPLQISTWISLPVINDHHHWTAVADADAGQLKKSEQQTKTGGCEVVVAGGGAC